MSRICDACGRDLGLLAAAGHLRDDDGRQRGQDHEDEQHFDERETAGAADG